MGEAMNKIILRNKPKLIVWLKGNPTFILQHVQSRELVTNSEYDRLKSITDPETKMIELLDIISRKGEKVCGDFLTLLKEEDVNEFSPELRAWINMVNSSGHICADGGSSVFTPCLTDQRTDIKEEEKREQGKKPIQVSCGLGQATGVDKNQTELLSQAKQERKQIIQQTNPPSNTASKPVDLPISRGESLNNSDKPHFSLRPKSGNQIHLAPYSSSLYRSGWPKPATVQASQSVSTLRQYTSSTSKTTPTEPKPQTPPQSRTASKSVICSFCNTPLEKGTAMTIDSLGIFYHLSCFKCFFCRSDLGSSKDIAEVRVRNGHIYCKPCYEKLKAGQLMAT